MPPGRFCVLIPLDTAASLKKGNFNTPSENSSKKDGGGLECDFKTAVRPLYSIGASKLCRPYNGFFIYRWRLLHIVLFNYYCAVIALDLQFILSFSNFTFFAGSGFFIISCSIEAGRNIIRARGNRKTKIVWGSLIS